MQITRQRWPKGVRISWRRHLPIWMGLERFDRRILGVYLRVGDRVWLVDSDRQLAAAAARAKQTISSRR